MYYDKALQDISNVIQAFFIEEQGNRITSNNIQGLSFKIKSALESNKAQPKNSKPLKTLKPGKEVI